MDSQTKQCFKCKKTLSLNNFYRHPQMGDGYLNKCKECNKRDVIENYQKKREQYSEYEAKRNKNPERRRKRHEYEKLHNQRYPEKAKARYLIRKALQIGKLMRQPCQKCGNEKSQAHHDDYSKSLEVRWLCFKHHREHHGQTVTVESF